MARQINRLAAVALKSLGEGLHPDGQGLYFQVKNGSRSWLFRYTLNGRARWHGLGAFPDTTLSDARQKASECRQQLQAGIDPIEAKRAQSDAARLAIAKRITFKEAAEQCREDLKAGWRNKRHATQWFTTLETHAFPTLGKLPVQEIDTALVLRVLRPIWATKNTTAQRVRQRIEAVLDWATANKLRTGDNPAKWDAGLSNALSSPKQMQKAQPVKHHPAMPHKEMPGFWDDLKQRDAASAKALSFLILTATRSEEVREARLGDVDFAAKVWTIPQTKNGAEHRVPLTDEALALLAAQEHLKDAGADALLFPNPKGRRLSSEALRQYLQEDMGKAGVTVHGMRTTFRTWAQEETNYPWWVAEAAIAHKNGTKLERAYARSDLLERRRRLMRDWSRYCTAGSTARGAEVVSLQPAAAG